jgi:hypothetical protein
MAAPGGWFTCSVERTGPADDGKIYVWLNDQGGKFNHWFYAVEAMQSEILATALTAISAGLLVDVSVSSIDQYSQLSRIYVKR